MKGRDAITIAVFALVAFLSFMQTANGAEKDIVIKIATLAPEGSSWMKTFNTINTEVMEKTEGQIRFKIYPGGVLGDERDMLRKMQINQIQGAALSSAGLSIVFQEIDVLQIPFLFQNYGEVDYVLTKMDTFFKKGFEENGYILLGWSEAGFIYLMSKTPISSVNDIKKTKVWIWQESPMAKVIFDEAGVAAIPLSLPDVLVGLQTGLVDVVYVPPTLAISLQWFTRIRYITDVPLAYIAGGIVVRKDVFKRLSQPYQKILIETFQRHMDQLKAITRDENREAITVMAKHGVEVVIPSQDHVDEFKRLSDRAMGHLHLGSHSFSQEVFDTVSSHLTQFRKGER